jgi:Spy/CpxP family protein refolding chaperone
MKMKRIFTSALALLLITGAATAQTNEKAAKKHQMHQKHDGKMMKELNLTAEQKAKLKSIHEQQKAEADALKNQKLTVEERKAKLKQLHEKYEPQLKAVLTAEQRQKMEAARANHSERADVADRKRHDGEHRDTIRARGDRQHGMKGMKEKGDRAEIAKELNLTSDQKEKVKQIQQDTKGKLEALRNESGLSKDQKKAKMREIMDAQQAQMKTVLTAEQLEKMKSLRKDRPGKAKK